MALPSNLDWQQPPSTVQGSEIGKSNDLSWLQEGQLAMAKREQKIMEEQASLPDSFCEMHKKIADHIKTIKTALAGCFGFYRSNARDAKIVALENILSHFQENLFDVNQFSAALNSYRTKDVSASIGKSKTKELIDELEIFAQRAKHYMLTDANGKIQILPNQPPRPSLLLHHSY